MSAAGLAYETYQSQGGPEWMMRIGAAEAPPILFVAPLFEEMNRTRALIVATMRRLAERGFGCWLPDLPGTGESERALVEQIRRLLALPMNKRTNFLRVRFRNGGSHL